MTAAPSPPEARFRIFPGWVVVWVGFFAIALVFGARFSLGLFLPFLPEALNSTTASVSAAFGLAMLSAGLIQPLVGIASDRFGSRNVLLIGLATGGAAFAGTGVATELWQIAVLMGIAGGISFACINPVMLTALVTVWFERQRGRALGVVTAGSKLAMILLLPAVTASITFIGWRETLIVLGVAIWLLLPVAWLLVRSTPEEMGLRPYGAADLTAPVVGDELPAKPPAPGPEISLLPALRTTAFWLLALSLFSNGFVMNLVFLHLPSFILQQGYGQAFASLGLIILGAVGLFGNVLTGALSDSFGRKRVLMLLFAARALVTGLVIAVPGLASLIVFAVVFGFLGYGAVGLVGAMTADVFGRRALGAILGTAYVFNQIGAGLGIYAGGLSVDLTGNYTAALAIAATGSLFSVLFIWFFPERRISLA